MKNDNIIFYFVKYNKSPHSVSLDPACFIISQIGNRSRGIVDSEQFWSFGLTLFFLKTIKREYRALLCSMLQCLYFHIAAEYSIGYSLRRLSSYRIHISIFFVPSVYIWNWHCSMNSMYWYEFVDLLVIYNACKFLQWFAVIYLFI